MAVSLSALIFCSMQGHFIQQNELIIYLYNIVFMVSLVTFSIEITFSNPSAWGNHMGKTSHEHIIGAVWCISGKCLLIIAYAVKTPQTACNSAHLDKT